MSSNGNASPKLPVYLDNHATTPLDPRVLEAMLPFLTSKFGNAASNSHSFGWEAAAAVESARRQIAAAIGASPQEIVFTSGATESDNLAVLGVAEAQRSRGNHVITAVSEHKAILDSCKYLEKHGYRVTWLPVKPDGLIDLDQLKDSFTPQTILVTIMAANNETGVLQPIEEIGRLCRERGILFHSDAVQALGKVPLNVQSANLDLASLTAHKLYGPKGCGALFVSSSVAQHLQPMIHGGGHEHGLRSGTLNVPGIVGFGKACELAQHEMPEESCRIAGLRNRLRDRLTSALDQVVINGSMEHRVPGNLNMSFLHVEGETLLTGLHDVALSSGSACSSGKTEASHVLKALGLSDEAAGCAIRFGIGRFNTEAEIDYVAERVIELVKNLREVAV
ncbi:MAG TPA: aminotransferase class V-fold PLP-dependent enzyme [Candidatus Angelobacter sp.]|nr:aminotransferase class V-fold PLP-dependent enzyme [Candidatus Angelobacter sp.]